jgi:hypothetical protein
MAGRQPPAQTTGRPNRSPSRRPAAAAMPADTSIPAGHPG